MKYSDDGPDNDPGRARRRDHEPIGSHGAHDRALVEAHDAGDAARLARLYAAAADASASAEAAAFYRTHAYVFALEAGDPLADSLHAALVAAGREEA